MSVSETYTGSCLCGAVTFEIKGPLPAPTACHCRACRKVSGHFEASTDVQKSALSVKGTLHLQWFASSQKVRRGFCAVCGSSLFFDAIYKEWIGVSMGTFEGPTRTRLARHIFVADKGDYYQITDGLPQNRQ